jgi:uncharacterized protein
MVHISQLSSRYVRDPHEVVTVGQIVKVWVLEIDKARRRVALTMIQPGTERPQPQKRQRPEKGERRPRPAPQPQAVDGQSAPPSAARPPRRQPPARTPREQQPRTYTAVAKKPPKPISKEMREGKEPLRTFGDLKQFFDKRESAGEQE